MLHIIGFMEIKMINSVGYARTLFYTLPFYPAKNHIQNEF